MQGFGSIAAVVAFLSTDNTRSELDRPILSRL